MTAPRPSPAGLSPLLDQLDEARERVAEWLFDTFFGDEAELPEGWLEDKADALLSGPLAPLTAAIRAVLAECETAERIREHNLAAFGIGGTVSRVGTADIRSVLTAALTPGADTAGATA